jgi:hypothetical protein
MKLNPKKIILSNLSIFYFEVLATVLTILCFCFLLGLFLPRMILFTEILFLVACFIGYAVLYDLLLKKLK